MSLARLFERHGALVTALAVLVFGSALRFHQLGHDGLWSDELFTASMVRQHPLTPDPLTFRRTTVFGIAPEDSFWTAKGAEQSPPLFELLTKGVLEFLSPSELSLRLVSALAGCAWLAFLALRAWRTRDPLLRRTYLAALFMGAVSVALVEYSQEGRAYGLGTLFTGILATRWMERWYEGFGRAELPRACELVLFVLGCHTHYNVVVFSALLLSTYGVVALRTKRYADLARLALVPLACLPWIAINAHTILFTSRGGVRWREIGLAEALGGALRCASELPGTPLLVLALLVAAVMVGRLAFGRTAGSPAVRRTLLALGVLSAIYIPLIGMVTMRAGMMHPRYYLYLLPALHLGVALLLASLLERAAPVAVAMALLGVGSFADLRAYYAREREGYREVTQWLRTQATDARAPVIFTWAPNLAMYRLYLESFFDPQADERAIPISQVQDGPATCERVGEAPTVLVIAHATHRPLADAALAACSGHYRLAGEQVVRDVLGQVWARQPAPAESPAPHPSHHSRP
ncbi:MAG: hypothetical protein L0Y66_26510, partial [Myxococcaceae bacterium]|nr:hypothetical protein [Myxococcaceae bacterium]